MAKAKVYGLDEFIKGLDKLLDNTQEIAKDMLNAAAPTLEEALRSEIKIHTDKGYATGELAKSIVTTDVIHNGYGFHVKVRPEGTDVKGVRNGEKLAYLEYGTSNQEPRPVMAKAIKKTESECTEKMQKEFDKAVNKYMGI